MSTNTTTGQRARKRPRRRTCRGHRGTTIGVKRHDTAGELSCHHCYVADAEARGTATVLTRWQLARLRRARGRKRTPDYEQGYNAGYAAARRAPRKAKP